MKRASNNRCPDTDSDHMAVGSYDLLFRSLTTYKCIPAWQVQPECIYFLIKRIMLSLLRAPERQQVMKAELRRDKAVPDVVRVTDYEDSLMRPVREVMDADTGVSATGDI